MKNQLKQGNTKLQLALSDKSTKQVLSDEELDQVGGGWGSWSGWGGYQHGGGGGGGGGRYGGNWG